MEKLFVLGRPGSGKSTAARHIAALATEAGWYVGRLNDYRILQDMALHQPQLFHRRPDGGFDARDRSVLRDALIQLRYAIDDKEIAGRQDVSAATEKRLLIVEFARDEYREAIEDIMQPAFASNAHLLFIHADIDICLRRVHERTRHPFFEDDHPSFSDNIFLRYYQQDNLEFIQALLEQYSFEQCIEVIESNGTLDQFKQYVSSFGEKMLRNESLRLVATAPGETTRSFVYN